jgi:hypothetical protein
MAGPSYVSVGKLGQYWRLLLKDHVSDLAAWKHLLDQHANRVLVCDPPLPEDPKDLWLDPPPRTGSRTMNAPHIWVKTDDGLPLDASAFKAQLLESESGAYAVDDKPPPKPPVLVLPSPPPPYEGPLMAAQRERTEATNALLHKQNELLEAIKAAALAEKDREREPVAPPAAKPVEKEPDAVPADTRKPSAIEDQRQADVAPHDDKALRKWILETCARWSRSISEDGLNGWLRGKYVGQFGEQANEESLRRKFDRYLKDLQDYPREW